MFEILTPLAKLHRVSRQIEDVSAFVAHPGLWGALNANGTIKNVPEGTPSIVTKLIVGNCSSDPYESHDVKGSGRISTIEDVGFRFSCDSDCYTGEPDFGDFLAVSDQADALGKLFDLNDSPNGESGDYEAVARVEEVYADGVIVCRAVSSGALVTATSGGLPGPVALYYYSALYGE